MNSINLRLCRIKGTQKKTNKPRCLRSRYCWNDREGAGNVGNYYHRENSLRYGTVCLMARCCCWWELLLWSKDEEIFTSRSKIHWHWRDQGTGKMMLNALPTRHKEFTQVMSGAGEKKSLHVTHKGRTQRADSYSNRSERYMQAQWASLQESISEMSSKRLLGVRSEKYSAGWDVRTHLEGHETNYVSWWEEGHG